jgi:hypothetical protein
MHCRYWDLKIEEIIRSRFADPQFRAAHGTGRDYEDPTNMFACSTAFEELDAICEGKIGKHKPEEFPDTSLWSLGSDAVNLTTFTKKKTNACGLRCEEMPPHLSHTKCSFEPFIIIEDDAADQTDCLKRTIDVLLKHSPIPSAGEFHLPNTVFSSALLSWSNVCTLILAKGLCLLMKSLIFSPVSSY